jgi:hypothetical protein
MSAFFTISTTLLTGPFFQGDGPYGATSNFLRNFFFDGIGYWFYFLILALAALIWILYDSSSRKLDAVSWRIGAVVALLLLVPSIFFKFSVLETEVVYYYDVKGQIEYLNIYQEPDTWRHTVDDLGALLTTFPPLTGAVEPIMYMGILGGIGGPMLAIAYYISNQGVTGSSQASRPGGYVPPPPPPPPPGPGPKRDRRPIKPLAPPKPKAHAWLIGADGRSYQLNQGVTTLGRSAENDIQIGGDSTVSGRHAKIEEQNNHFKLFDLGSTNGIKVNGRVVREPVLLAANDQVQLGDHTVMNFVTSQR